MEEMASLQQPAAAGSGPCCSSTTSSNGRNGHSSTAPPSQQPPAPAATKAAPRSDAAATSNPYPTTFVQADAASFKQVVQLLTGSTETAAKHQQNARSEPSRCGSAAGQPAASKIGGSSSTGPKRPAFKLYERRHNSSFKSLKIVNPHSFVSGPNSPHPKPTEIPSPSVVLDFPSLTLSPVTPEERAIAQKGFYLHPSPRSGDAPPRLLPLFPVTSPRTGESASF